MSECSSPTMGFEGPEKTIEIDFQPSRGPAAGLRLLTRETLDALCEAARCTILNHESNEHFDSYVLSESSMFVYPRKFIMKTCGTTTLLRCIPLLLKKAEELKMELEWFSFSRKDFLFPSEQLFPHNSTDAEIKFLKQIFPSGHAYMLGPVTEDHWFVFVADHCDRPSKECTESTLNVMMYDLEPEVAEQFFCRDPAVNNARQMTTTSGIDKLLDGAHIQDFMFEPCGYSMNALKDDTYYTIHITPESNCSYASFETNLRADNYDKLIADVLHVFRPKRFTMTMFADEAALHDTSLPFHAKLTSAGPKRRPKSLDDVPSGSPTVRVVDDADDDVNVQWAFARTAQSNTEFEGDYCCYLGNYKRTCTTDSDSESYAGRSTDSSVDEMHYASAVS